MARLVLMQLPLLRQLTFFPICNFCKGMQTPTGGRDQISDHGGWADLSGLAPLTLPAGDEGPGSVQWGLPGQK